MGSSRTRHSTRARRASSRLSSSVKASAIKLSPPIPPPSPAVLDALSDIVKRLEVVHAVLICAAHALRDQDTDIDEDVALAIQRCGSDVIDAQLEKLHTLLASSSGGAP
jgi:hypothetical protein